MKKTWITALLSTVLAVGFAATAGCTTADTSSRSVADNVTTTGDFYSYGAASVGSIISSAAGTAASGATASATSATALASLEVLPVDATVLYGSEEKKTKEPTESQLETINGYMNLVEYLLGNGKMSDVQTASDREEYEIKDVVSYSDLEGNVYSYTMYYNYTLIGAENEETEEAPEEAPAENQETEEAPEEAPAENQETEEGDPTDAVAYGDKQIGEKSPSAEDNYRKEKAEEFLRYGEEERDEIKYTVEGIMIIDGTEYPLEGSTETEQNKDGEESESYFRVTLGEGSYVMMKLETEEDEQAMVYSVVENHKTVEEVKFQYENEHGETELKMTIEKDGAKTELKFEEETEGDRRAIKVEYAEEGLKIEFRIVVTQDEDGNDVYRYEYGEKTKDFGKKIQGKQESEQIPEQDPQPEQPEQDSESEQPEQNPESENEENQF